MQLGLSPTRRELIAAFAAGTLLSSRSLAQTPPAGPRLIDIHRHFISPAYLKVLNAKTGHKVDGFTNFFPLGPWNNYSPARDIETMDKQGIATSLVSTTSPGTWFGNRDETRGLAREMNEYGAKMATDYKGRFGLFAVLPLPDVDASLREIDYAFDTLKADGVGLLTSYGNMWLGDPAFQPVFDELNRRNAVVYTHPTDAACCHGLLPNTSPGTIEWQTDTSRAIFNLINDNGGRTSAATRHANIHFIWSHGGGTLIGLMNRFLGYGNLSPQDLAKPAAPNSKLFHLRRFYYDTAQFTDFLQLGALKGLVGASQIVFGADYPYSTIVNHVDLLKNAGMTAAELAGIDRENALRILPKYR